MKKETICVGFSDLALIISGLYFGEDLDIEKTEELIDYLNDNEDKFAVVESYRPNEEESE